MPAPSPTKNAPKLRGNPRYQFSGGWENNVKALGNGQCRIFCPRHLERKSPRIERQLRNQLSKAGRTTVKTSGTDKVGGMPCPRHLEPKKSRIIERQPEGSGLQSGENNVTPRGTGKAISESAPSRTKKRRAIFFQTRHSGPADSVDPCVDVSEHFSSFLTRTFVHRS